MEEPREGTPATPRTRRGRHPWSAASLARPMVSRGKSRVHTQLRSALYVAICFVSHAIAQPDDRSAPSSALLPIGLASEAALHGWRPLLLSPTAQRSTFSRIVSPRQSDRRRRARQSPFTFHFSPLTCSPHATIETPLRWSGTPGKL